MTKTRSAAPRISELWKYPVKSCGGFKVNTIGFTQQGPNDDRSYTLIDERGIFVSQRTHPMLAMVKTSILDGNVRVSIPGVGGIVLYESREAGLQRKVSIHNKDCVGFTQYKEADELFSTYLKQKVELVRHYSAKARVHAGSKSNLPVWVRFADAYPITVLSARALFHLNQWLLDANEQEVGVERFRPNILVEDCLPHEEDGWRAVSIGMVRLRFEKLCSRCTIPDVNPATGKYDDRRPVTKALAKYRRVMLPADPKVYFSSNFAVELPDEMPCGISVGNLLTVRSAVSSAA